MVSGMTYTPGVKINYFRGRGSYTITSAGKTFYYIQVRAIGGSYTLQDALTCAVTVEFYEGTLDFNDYNVTSPIFWTGDGGTRVLNLGNGTITLNSTATTTKLNIASINLTFDAENSTIILTSSSANAQTFAGGGLTFNHVRVEGAGAYTLTITGDNIFGKLRNDSSVAVKTILLTPTSTQTIRKLQVFSSAANVAVFQTGGAAATIQKHRGYCELNHVSLTAIVAGEKYKYYAGNNSTDGTGNTNWIFSHKARPE